MPDANVAHPDRAILDTIPNPESAPYCVRFTVPEFTTICPKTGQPDFAHLVIDYIPNQRLVESKSLKLFMYSFRQHGAYHENTTTYIGRRLVDVMQPHWLRIGGYWYPRGGIPIDVFWQSGSPLPFTKRGVWIPEQNIPTYRGRG